MNTKKIVFSLGAALVAFLLICSVCWVGGFNFDHRNPDVGAGYCFALLVAFAAFFAVVSSWEEKK